MASAVLDCNLQPRLNVALYYPAPQPAASTQKDNHIRSLVFCLEPLRLTIAMPHRSTPTATLNLQIPSLHDSLLLDTRVYLPLAYTSPAANAPWKRKIAVVAHPYAPLGGSYDDYVVLRVAGALLKMGWVVATFNFRGAHGSRGRTTWTGNSEIMDYTSVVAWVLAYVQSLPPPESPAPSPTDGGTEQEEPEKEEVISLLLAGYSYGSLIASHLPSTDKYILPLVAHPPADRTAFSGAIDAARRSARQWRESHSTTRTSYSGSSANRAGILQAAALQERKNSCSPIKEQQDHWEDREKKWRVVSSYLLISPLLPPVSSFLMGFGQWRVSSWTGWTKGLVGMGQHHRNLDGAADGTVEVLGIDEPGTEVLAVYGDGDVFTSVRKYQRWKEKMNGVNKVWRGVEIEGAGHFWHDIGALEELEKAVIGWVR